MSVETTARASSAPISAELALITACWLAHRDAKRRAKAPKHAAPVVLWPWSPGLDARRERAA